MITEQAIVISRKYKSFSKDVATGGWGPPELAVGKLSLPGYREVAGDLTVGD